MTKYVRYEHGGDIHFGRVDDAVVSELSGAPWAGAAQPTGVRVPLSSVKLLCPVTPSKIVACGVTYSEHASEAKELLQHHGFESAAGELIFGMRAPIVLNDPEGKIVKPAFVQRLDHEAELGVVIGKRTKRVSEADAWGSIFGVTCYNDCGARDIQMKSPLFSQKAKSIDTFGCCGPWIVTEGVDLRRARIECRVNGEVRQSATLADMTRSIASIVSEISRTMTLLPGDLIATGSPAGVSPMGPGDVVEVEIEGVGVLRNTVVADTP
ncbi:MAG: fumarylacetoacetate hydrolase family protein [Chloroflexota bacterium]|nr:fumarylacetoacetate hydrolase family protein [Chloroflexota bacterium]